MADLSALVGVQDGGADVEEGGVRGGGRRRLAPDDAVEDGGCHEGAVEEGWVGGGHGGEGTLVRDEKESGRVEGMEIRIAQGGNEANDGGCPFQTNVYALRLECSRRGIAPTPPPAMAIDT